MNYANNSNKFAAVLNGNVPIPRLLNALAHTTAGLTAALDRSAVTYLDYENAADQFHSKIAEAPFIILKAKNGNQLSTLRAQAKAEGVAHNTFISAMIGPSAEEQLKQTYHASGDSLEYWVVVLYGPAEAINPLTKTFSLFNISVSDQGG